eukprot:sb/3471807/
MCLNWCWIRREDENNPKRKLLTPSAPVPRIGTSTSAPTTPTTTTNEYKHVMDKYKRQISEQQASSTSVVTSNRAAVGCRDEVIEMTEQGVENQELDQESSQNQSSPKTSNVGLTEREESLAGVISNTFSSLVERSDRLSQTEKQTEELQQNSKNFRTLSMKLRSQQKAKANNSVFKW